ncbi:L,D-transpeptidase [Elusimicrobiota bacterium]
MLNKKFTLDSEIHKRLIAITGDIPETCLLVSIQAQTLSMVKNRSVSATYPISTSKYGIGNQEGSNKTPPGIHRIAKKFGAGCPLGRIFKNRKDTGKDWQNEVIEEDLILTRILRLTGLEPGINQGKGIDSYERFIYFHGTNQEHLIGAPASHGCVRMKNSDIIKLFDDVEEGAIVIIS